MADGLELNAASGGATVATDDAGAGGHVQIVKLAISTDGSATLIPAEASNGLDVDVTRIQAGDNVIGRVKLSDGTDVALITAAGQLTVLDGNSADILTALQAIETAVEGTLTVDASGATVPISHAALTELAAALNASSQLDVNIAASGATVPVSGTVTANLSATDNTVLDNIDADLTTIIGHVDGIEGHVDGIEGLLTTIDTDTGNAATSLAVLDDWDQSDRAKVNAQEVSGVMIENAVDVTVKYAAIDVASSGDNTLVAAVTGKKIRVLSAFLVSAGTVTARFESGASGTALTGQMSLVANTGFVLPHNPHGWFQTADGALLNLELSAGVSVDGSLTYVEAE